MRDFYSSPNQPSSVHQACAISFNAQGIYLVSPSASSMPVPQPHRASTAALLVCARYVHPWGHPWSLVGGRCTSHLLSVALSFVNDKHHTESNIMQLPNLDIIAYTRSYSYAFQSFWLCVRASATNGVASTACRGYCNTAFQVRNRRKMVLYFYMHAV